MATTIQIVGHKKSGKTYVTTALIKKLQQAGYRVAAIKHDAHRGSMDVPGTDSARMAAAGARQVVLESSQGFFFHQPADRPPLEAIVALLSPSNDYVVIEGHKEAAYPQVILLKDGEQATDFSSHQVITAAHLVTDNQLNQPAADQLVDYLFNYLSQGDE